MKTLIRFSIALALLVGLGSPAFAQIYPATTTLSVAVTSTSQTTVTLASVTGTGFSNTNGWELYMDGEAMTLVGSTPCNTTTKVCRVARGQNSTIATKHPASAVVIQGPPYMFQTADVDGQGSATTGACTASNYLYLPIVNVRTGNVWLCRATGSSGVTTASYWTGTNSRNLTYNSLLTNLN